MAEIFRMAVPVFLTVVLNGAEVVLTCWLPKARDDGVKEIPDCVPVPERLT